MFYKLPPVGNPVSLHGSKDVSDTSVLFPCKSYFYESGTAALAAAIIAAVEAAEQSRKIDHAEIILPAYGCPDLVSAVEFTGARPVLVDLEADRSWLDLSGVAAAINENTVAIVAVDLFGIAERWPQLRELADRNGLVLIEDSAQYFPAETEKENWHGDLVVLSFGRGKPVTLLGGGAVLAKNSGLYTLLPKPTVKPASIVQGLLFGLKARIYNAMISPLLYWIPQALPFLHLGETRYHPLRSIAGIDQSRLALLASNISRYRNDFDEIARCEKISSMLKSIHGIINLPLIEDIEVKPRLLRYPLLLDEASRDGVYGKLKQAGLGVSILYPTSLPKIAGMEHILDNRKHFVNAESFASRLITLPTHSKVSDKSIANIQAVLRDQLQ